jgi:hypothetical protein
MLKEIIMYKGDLIAKYEETDAQKQMLWDAFIRFCQEHNSTTGESVQNDEFLIDSPSFIADAIDKIICFETKWVDD